MSATTALDQALHKAAGHVIAAAELLEASDTSEEIFSPARSLAAQLALIGNGISPLSSPALATVTRRTPVIHVDRALDLLESLIVTDAPGDLLVWAMRLQDLRRRVAALTTTPKS